jgi:hypothetical protein
LLTLQRKVMWHFGTITCNILVKLHVTFVKISVTFFVTFCDICPHIAAYWNQVKNMTWKLYSDKKGQYRQLKSKFDFKFVYFLDWSKNRKFKEKNLTWNLYGDKNVHCWSCVFKSSDIYAINCNI